MANTSSSKEARKEEKRGKFVNYMQLSPDALHKSSIAAILIILDVSFIGYFVSEVTHGYQLKEDKDLYSEKQRRVTTFMKTPRELEKVVFLAPKECYMVQNS